MAREATTFCKSSITKSGGQGRVEGSKGRRVPFFFNGTGSCPLKVLRIRVFFVAKQPYGYFWVASLQ